MENNPNESSNSGVPKTQFKHREGAREAINEMLESASLVKGKDFTGACLFSTMLLRYHTIALMYAAEKEKEIETMIEHEHVQELKDSLDVMIREMMVLYIEASGIPEVEFLEAYKLGYKMLDKAFEANYKDLKDTSDKFKGDTK